MRHLRLEHKLVDFMPERLEPGILYVSMDYATASHSCCCGCGEEIVTPFTPTDWKLTFDGETVSLNPSVGNWYRPCGSHYVVDHGRVIEAGPWDDDEIAGARRRDRAAKATHCGKAPKPAEMDTNSGATREAPNAPGGIGAWLKRVVSRLSGRT